MFSYIKKLQYPINIKNPDPKAAGIIISQYGGPHGELGASLRYLSQRYSMPYPELKGLLTDIGVEELGHLEMIGTMVHQLTRNLTEDQIESNPNFMLTTHQAFIRLQQAELRGVQAALPLRVTQSVTLTKTYQQSKKRG